MTTLAGLVDSPLGRTVGETSTTIWNDSCAVDELEYALGFGAVGATANPVIVTDVWRKDPARWQARVRAILDEAPQATEVEVAWRIVEEMSTRAARLLEPAFVAWAGRQGRMSVQVDPSLFRSPERMVEQAVHFDSLAPNIVVKLPATAAGIAAMEEATRRGVSINCTVSFSVSQAMAAAEAVERGLAWRSANGHRVDGMGPVVTIMVGRIEDWLRVLTERDGVVTDPAALPWSGVAVFKRAYGEFRQRGYRSLLLAAAIRHHYHWSEFVGGEVAITLPAAWQRRFNSSAVEVRPRMDEPVSPAIVAELSARFPDFVRAYEPGALSVEEFDRFPPTVRTLRSFIASYHDLLGLVNDAILPNPDVTPG